MSFAARQAISWTEQGLVPDRIIRGAIVRLLRARLAELRPDDAEHAADTTARFIEGMNRAPIALLPEKANEQHYELPPEFFAQALGPHRKYSCCHWGPGAETLGDAEEQAHRCIDCAGVSCIGLRGDPDARAEAADGVYAEEQGD